MIVHAVVLLPVFFVVLGPALLRWRRNEMSTGRFVAMLIFSVYLFQVASLVLFPLHTYESYLEDIRNVNPFEYVNLVPLHLARDYGGLFGHQAVGNLLLLAPFGFGFPFVTRLKARWVLIVGTAVSLGLELLQFLLNALHVAYPLKVIDINDVIFNIIGLGVGYGVFVVSGRLYARLFGSRRFDSGVWQHFHETLIAADQRNTRRVDRIPR